jgi:hypothetical protein
MAGCAAVAMYLAYSLISKGSEVSSHSKE